MNTMNTFRSAPPKASALLESLRGIGYSPETAIADIIDNSISARASRVDVRFEWFGQESRITILDNGLGMDEARLDLAMRLGVADSTQRRNPEDLGRFGLGLKTASFSQCRRLTVASKHEGRVSCLHWDLDVLASDATGEWRLMVGPPSTSASLVHKLNAGRDGTLVVWECLDRIVGPQTGEQDFLDLIDRVERHLSMVFHQFLEARPAKLTIAINGRSVNGWDPFLMSNPATWRSPVERLGSSDGIVEVQCFVLPHKERLDSRAYDLAAGPDGWTAQQGLYVYRQQRMLVAGSWLGLGTGRAWTKEEAHRLARIRVEIPNSADHAWRIDIKKAAARVPLELRERLTRLAEDTRARARRVFAARGSALSVRQAPVQQVWRVVSTANGARYRIDDQHPMVRSVLDEPGTQVAAVQAMIRVIEETVPVQRIWLDTVEAKEIPRTGFATSAPEEVLAVLSHVFCSLVLRKGMSEQRAREHLLETEPFNLYPELVMALSDAPKE